MRVITEAEVVNKERNTSHLGQCHFFLNKMGKSHLDGSDPPLISTVFATNAGSCMQGRREKGSMMVPICRTTPRQPPQQKLQQLVANWLLAMAQAILGSAADGAKYPYFQGR